jgi:hypothetical protein
MTGPATTHIVVVTSDTTFGPAEWATITAAAIAALVAVAGYFIAQARARRERRAKAFADALAAVEDYLEAPYRVRRRQASTPEARAALTSALNDLQARIELHRAWLQVEAPAVADAYEALVSAARTEAGTQMADAWNSTPPANDGDMNLRVAYEHPEADTQRLLVIRSMRRELRLWSWRARRRRNHADDLAGPR